MTRTSPTFALLVAILVGCSSRPIQPPNIRYADKVTMFDHFYGNGDCEVEDLLREDSKYYVKVFCIFDTGYRGTKFVPVEDVRKKSTNE